MGIGDKKQRCSGLVTKSPIGKNLRQCKRTGTSAPDKHGKRHCPVHSYSTGTGKRKQHH